MQGHSRCDLGDRGSSCWFTRAWRQAPDFLQNVRNFVERQKLAGVVLPPSVSEDDELVKILQEFDCPYVRIASGAAGRGRSIRS